MTILLPSVLAFDAAGSDLAAKLLRQRQRRKSPAKEDGRLCCVRCGHVITRLSERTSVYGEHEHVRTNPFGFTFRLGCFSAAPGCRLTGTPTSGDTWFAGYRWRIALCGGCQNHLGWAFSGSGPDFYGLVLDYLSKP